MIPGITTNCAPKPKVCEKQGQVCKAPQLSDLSLHPSPATLNIKEREKQERITNSNDSIESNIQNFPTCQSINTH